jgi:hypothetical protein
MVISHEINGGLPMNMRRLSPLKQIRLRCLDCRGNQYKQVRFCDTADCPLWYLRFGKMPQTVIRNEGRVAEKLFRPENFQT